MTTTTPPKENITTDNNETPDPVMDDVSSELTEILDSIQLQRSLALSFAQKNIDTK